MTADQPSFWNDPTSSRSDVRSPPRPAVLPPVDAGQDRAPRQQGRGWAATSLILNALSLLGVMILPHVSALLAIAAGACAGIVVRRSTGRSKLGIASLIISAALFIACSAALFIACVIYTIITIQAGFAYLEDRQ